MRSPKSLMNSMYLLPMFLKTMSIILSSAGPSTLSLSQMTSELWTLALSLRSKAANDPAILEAVLFTFLTILKANEDKRGIATEHSSELVETQEWVAQVYASLEGGSEEDERCRVLAAGVMMGAKDIVEEYERLLVGRLGRF